MIINKLIQSQRKIGWFNTMIYYIDRLLIAFYCGFLKIDRVYIFAQPVNKKIKYRKERKKIFKAMEVSSNHPIIHSFPRSQNIIKKRFNEKSKCIVLMKQDEFVGYSWLAFDQYNDDQYKCKFKFDGPVKMSWDFDIYISEKYRISTAFLRLWDSTNEYLANESIEWTLSRIAATNTNSISSHMKLGGFPIGSIIFLKIGNYQVLISNLRPKIQFTTKINKIPIVKIKSDFQNIQSISQI